MLCAVQFSLSFQRGLASRLVRANSSSGLMLMLLARLNKPQGFSLIYRCGCKATAYFVPWRHTGIAKGSNKSC